MGIQKFSKTLVTMGDGDVMTGLVLDGPVGMLMFFDKPGFCKFGDAPEEHAEIEEADLCIAFKSPAAIDGVIRSLNQLKEKMQ